MQGFPWIETTNIQEVRSAVSSWRFAGERIALVPTMGYLHEGHLSLVRLARARARRVVVSIFVNPMQFGPSEDLSRYPRDLNRDRDLLAGVEGGIDLLFLPAAELIYPEPFQTAIEVSGVSEGLCGGSRPGHFRGVATVVAKLFNIVLPDVAVFGQKDAQQLAVIRTMARDLDFPVEIAGGPTVREADGLALSSRNTFLSAENRRQALVLSRTLFAARDLISAGQRDGETIRRFLRETLPAEPGVKLEYADAVDAESMAPLFRLRGSVLLAAAIFVGATRLIDNVRIDVPAES